MLIPPDRELVKGIPFDGGSVGEPVPWWFEYDKHGMSIYARSPDGRVFHWDGHLVGPVGGKMLPVAPQK